MSSVLDPKALAESPLADLHLLANELGVDGFRRLRKAELVDAIVARQSGGDFATGADQAATGSTGADESASSGVRGEDPADPALADVPAEIVDAVSEESDSDTDTDSESEETSGRRGRRGRRGGRSRSRSGEEDEESRETEPSKEEVTPSSVEGVVELLPNGSGFLRLSPPDAGDDDVYVSAAQVKRCELVSGDRVSGPVRKPRNSERFASLIRVDTINGRPADEVVEATRFDDRAVRFPSERIVLEGGDPTLDAIGRLTPFGRGSRVAIVGPARSGKTEALRRIARALGGQEELEVIVVLAGARPEEVSEWTAEGLPAPLAAVTLGASAEVQAQAVEQAIEQGRRVATRGANAVVIIDSLEQVPTGAARRAMAAARAFVDGGSVTVLAAAPAGLGGETTVITLDAALTAQGRFPALDLPASGSMRPELLVGEDGAQAIIAARR